MYAYLRSKDSERGKAGSPYYVGLATGHRRPFTKHRVQIPKDHKLIRVFKSGLSKKDVAYWECFFIKKFGRIDLGKGCLANLTDGGDGNLNPSQKTRNKISQAAKKQANRMREMAAAMKGKRLSAEHKAKCSRSLKGRSFTEEHKAKISAALKGKPKARKVVRSLEARAKCSAALKGRVFKPETLARQTASARKRATRQKAHAAHLMGLPYTAICDLTANQRKVISVRHKNSGCNGYALFKGLAWNPYEGHS